MPVANTQNIYILELLKQKTILEYTSEKQQTKQTTSDLFQNQLGTGHKKDNFCKAIANIRTQRVLLIRETIEIEKLGFLNETEDTVNLPNTWKGVICNKTQRTIITLMYISSLSSV